MSKPIEIQTYIDELAGLLTRSDVKLGSVKAQLMETAFLTGAATALGGVHKLPPAVVMCGMSGRSVTTLNTKPQ